MKLVQLYDYNKHKGEPIDLYEFLNLKGTKENLKDKRCLYVVKPNSDPMLKFGIAGLDGGTSAYGRLLQYVNLYSTNVRECSCFTWSEPNTTRMSRPRTPGYSRKKNTLLTISSSKESEMKTDFTSVEGEKEF
jgi:hypothetical protein